MTGSRQPRQPDRDVIPVTLRLRAQFPQWFIWLDLSGWHARYPWEPHGAKPRVTAATPDGLIAKLHAVPPQAPAGHPDPTRPAG